jgi:hypothetical protein
MGVLNFSTPDSIASANQPHWSIAGHCLKKCAVEERCLRGGR